MQVLAKYIFFLRWSLSFILSRRNRFEKMPVGTNHWQPNILIESKQANAITRAQNKFIG